MSKAVKQRSLSEAELFWRGTLYRPAFTVYTAGFTLVELVIALVLTGILSSLGVGLLTSPSTYSAGAARDQFVATAQLAQQWSFANTGNIEATAELRIDESPNEWAFSVYRSDEVDGDDEPVFGPKEARRERATLQADSLTISYDNNGKLDSGQDLEFIFSGNSDYRACISALGFAYPGGCQ